MKRNEFAPVFKANSYEATVSEHDPVGTNVTRVSATDDDLTVSITVLPVYISNLVVYLFLFDVATYNNSFIYCKLRVLFLYGLLCINSQNGN